METIQGLQTVEMKIKDFFLQYPIMTEQYVDNNGKIEVKKVLTRCGLSSKYNDNDVISLKRPSAYDFFDIQKNMNSTDFDICQVLDIKINNIAITINDLAKKLSQKEFLEFNSVLVFFMKGETILI